MDQARPDGQRPGEPAAPATSTDQQVTEPLHALFYRRVAGDDALLQLAGLRFAQAGLAAETYADSPGELRSPPPSAAASSLSGRPAGRTSSREE